MGLTAYKQKRNLEKTPEPKGKSGKVKKMPVFVVQRHKASHLHYDFRIEADGVLKSWAVPKGPSMNPDDKRLAMMVEDHPFDYKDFEGVIPEGNYGAGIVEIWDSGTYSTLDEITDKKGIEDKTLEGIEKGSIKIHLYGKKLKGEFALVKTKNDYQKDAWLLIKHKDEYATTVKYNSEDETEPNSPINNWLKQSKNPTNHRNPRTAHAHQNTESKNDIEIVPKSLDTGNKEMIKPMLAKETPKPFNSADWVFELKWDGYRAIAELDHGNVRLYSRNGIIFNNKYPALINELKRLKSNMVIDGEIVLLDNEGKPDFGRLQDYPNNTEYPLVFYVFDLLYLNKKNYCNLPLLERKKILKETLQTNDIIKYTDHFNEKGIQFFQAVQKLDLEGIMAKKASSFYYPGRRTNSWLKIKQHGSRELFIAGYTAPGGDRDYFGSLILAEKKNNSLVYVGHVGTGFDETRLKLVYEILKPLQTTESPFDIKIPTRTPITWVKPQVLCEVKFSEITKAGILRHPVFVDIIEYSKNQQKNEAPQETGMQKTAEPSSSASQTYQVDQVKVKLSHPTKLLFPEDKVDKRILADYYLKMAPLLLPYLKNRPQSLKRNPNGIHEPAFYHKNAGENVPEYIATQKIFSESNNKEIDYILCNNTASLLYIVNLGCIEINPWHSTVNNLDNPDYLVIDLDPSEKNTFDQVIEAAQVVYSITQKAKIDAYCKSSGATGMHIYIPLSAQYTYDEAKNFAHVICMLTHEQIPDFTTLERNLSRRGNDKIYLDHLQNRHGQTIACAYSARPQIGAPVSTPLNWNEVKPGLKPQQFNIFTIHQRIEKNGDLFKGVLGKGIDMHKAIKKLGN